MNIDPEGPSQNHFRHAPNVIEQAPGPPAELQAAEQFFVGVMNLVPATEEPYQFVSHTQLGLDNNESGT